MFKSSIFLLFMIIFIVGIVVVPGTAAAAGGSQVYVNTQGNDSWDGLSAVHNLSSGSGPKATIKNATGTVATNGTVYVASGTYRENQINITRSMNIIGKNRDNTIINGTNSGTIFNIIAGISVNIESITLANGNATKYKVIPNPLWTSILESDGGAINNQGILNLKNCVFRNNGERGSDEPDYRLHTYGGVIYNFDGGTLSVDNCVFINNTSFYGGAINNDGTLTIQNTAFTNNNADAGGAVHNTGIITVNNSTFTNNNADGGGAIYNTGIVTVHNSTFTSNNANGGGGAICTIGNSTIFNSIFTTNTALSGGAILTQSYLKVTNSTFINNTSNHGGAIRAYDNSIVNFNRFVGNTAGDGSGNIIESSGDMDARFNWWGTNNPNADHSDFDVSSGIFLYDPWIVLTVTVSPGNVKTGGVSNVTADLLHDNQGDLHDADDGLAYNGPANFKSSAGNIVDAFFVGGVARTTLNVGGAQGRVNVSATIDGETTTNSVYVGLATVNPVNGSIVPKNQNITITFSEPIMIGPGFNNITVTDKNGNHKNINLTINGVELIISPVGGWDSGGRFTLELPSNAVTSTGGDLLTLSLTSTFIVEADTIYVSKQGNDSWDGLAQVYNSSSGSGPKATIKCAVEFLAVNGTIYVASGTYNENNIKITRSMRIIGASKENTIINGNNGGAILDIASGAYVSISNLTFTNGKSTNNGGAIYNAGTLTVNNSAFTCNEAINRSGGAIYNAGTLSVNNSAFTNNKVQYGSGGAIYNAGTLSVNNSIFANNEAINRYGGAIYNTGAAIISISNFTNNTADYGAAIENNDKLTVNGCSFTGNTGRSAIRNLGFTAINKSAFTGNSGGAIFNMKVMTINDSIFTNNTAGNGAAIANNGGNLTVTNSTFTNNSATNTGGAISNSGILKVIDSVFHGNTATYEGGAITNSLLFVYETGSTSTIVGTLTIFNSTFTNNTARDAGVLYNVGGIVNITKSTFTGNAAIGPKPWGQGGVIYNRLAGNPSTGIEYFGSMTITDSIFSGNSAVRGGVIYNAFADLSVVSSVISNNTATGYSGRDGSFIYNEKGAVNLKFNWITNNIGNYDVYSEISSVDADNNWWGNNNGPGSRVYINRRTVSSWLVLTTSVDRNVANIGDSINIMINMLYNNWGDYLDSANGHVPDGVQVDITSLLGSFFDSTVKFFNGMAQAVFTPNSVDSGKISVNVDGQTVLELMVHVLDGSLDLNSLTSEELQSLRDALDISRENGLKWISDYLAGKNNSTSENNTDTPENNTSTNTTTNTPINSSSDGSPGGLTPGTGDGSPQESVPQDSDAGQTSEDTTLSVAGQSQKQFSEESLGDSGQNPKSYEITTNTTGNSASQLDTTLFTVIGVVLLLILVGIGFYFKK